LIFFDIVGFEDFMKAMLTVFVAITLEGWSLMMLNYMDAGSTWISPIFFISLVIFGAFFALNLVLA
jgi:voltage-dependent calcium channel L type alpha-1D